MRARSCGRFALPDAARAQQLALVHVALHDVARPELACCNPKARVAEHLRPDRLPGRSDPAKGRAADEPGARQLPLEPAHPAGSLVWTTGCWRTRAGCGRGLRAGNLFGCTRRCARRGTPCRWPRRRREGADRGHLSWRDRNHLAVALSRCHDRAPRKWCMGSRIHLRTGSCPASLEGDCDNAWLVSPFPRRTRQYRCEPADILLLRTHVLHVARCCNKSENVWARAPWWLWHV